MARHKGPRTRFRTFLALLGVFALLIMGLVSTSGTAAATSGSTISAKALNDHECNSSEWHFVITQVDKKKTPPASIHVTWANGASQDVPLDKVTGGVAHYATTSNLGSTVTSATAVIYEGWSGQFNLSHGPCGSTPPPNQCQDGTNPGDLNGDGTADSDDCGYTPPSDQCDDGSNPGDLNGDGEANEDDCGYVPPPQQCEDGSSPGDLNGDGTADTDDCGYTPPSDQCDDGTNPGDVDGDGDSDAADCDYTPPSDQCDDGSNPGDLNGDGEANEEDCGYTPPVITKCVASTGTTTVTPSNLQGFDFSETRSTGHYEFTEDGLRIWTESNTSTDKVAGYKAVDVPLASVGEPTLSYTNTAGVLPGFQLYVDNGHGVTGFVVGEPSAYGDNWWSNADFGVGSGGGYTSYGTLDEYLQANPDARVKAFGFSLGSGVKGEGVLAKITFGCHDYVFTTDKTPPPPSAEPGTASASSTGCVKPGSSDGTAVVTVNNTDDATNNSVTYAVTLGSQVKSVTVADGASGSVTFTGLAPGNYNWTVVGNDGTDRSGTVTVKQCDTPPPPPAECPAGTTWVDINGDGNVDEADGECMPDEVVPEEGAVSVVPGCGFVTVTNQEDSSLQFFYGSFSELEPDGIVTVPAGETVRVSTTRHSLDWMAVWDSGELTMGENLTVKQNCDNPPPVPPTPPTPVPPVWPTPPATPNTPTTADTGLWTEAGSASDGALLWGMTGALALLGLGFLGYGARRRGQES